MQVTINGEARELPRPMTIAELLDWLKVRRDGTAVEVNRTIVPRAAHVGSSLNEGDAVEIVTFVGGG